MNSSAMTNNSGSNPYPFLTALVLLETIQLSLAVILLFNQIPLQSDLYRTVMIDWLPMIHPERELVYFRFFILAAIAGQAFGLRLLMRRLKDAEFLVSLKALVWTEAFLTFCLLGAAFKMALYGYTAVLAQSLFYVLLGVAVVNKIFFREIRGLIADVLAFMSDRERLSRQTNRTDIGFMIGIIAVIWPLADLSARYGRVDDGWAEMAIGYYLVVYWLVRVWVRNPFIAMAAVLMGIKWQIFRDGAAVHLPLKTEWLGLYILIGSFLYARGYRRPAMVVTAMVAACLVHIFSTQPGLQQWGLSFAGIWDPSTAHVSFFHELYHRNFLSALIAVAMPLVYVMTLTASGGLVHTNKTAKEDIFAAAVAVYGLVVYAAYLVHPQGTGYYSGCVAYILVLCFWLKIITERVKPRLANVLIAAVFFAAIYALFTNQAFLKYPGLLGHFLYLKHG